MNKRVCNVPALLLALAFMAGCERPAVTASPELATVATLPEQATAPVKVKVVLVTMFEIGEDSGDQAGEFQLWKERRALDTVYEFGGHHALHLDADSGLLVMVTGIGTAKSAASVTLLGMDPRFDLTEAYWLVAGIAGFDPEDASLGSAAWAEYLVDGDLAHQIDPREMPADWTYGYIARHTTTPFQEDRPEPAGEVFQLNAGLTEWAYQLTRDIELPDFPSLQATRDLYTDHPNARKPPFVLKGDNLAAMTFWHGEILNNWANDWVQYWSDGKGQFVSSAMEDTGTMQALEYLDAAGRVDKGRLLVLRTASNYTMPPPGVTAAVNLFAENEGYAGLDASLESAYLVGSMVIDTLLANWEIYSQRLPTPEDIVRE